MASTPDAEQEESETLPEGARVIYTSRGEKRVLSAEDFEESEEERAYFNRIYSGYKRRTLQQIQTLIHEEDYADVDYWPYEWLLKVGTEYYFR